MYVTNVYIKYEKMNEKKNQNSDLLSIINIIMS